MNDQSEECKAPVCPVGGRPQPALLGEKLRQIGHGLFGVPSSHLFVLRLINFDTGDRHVSRRNCGDLPFMFTKLLTGRGLDRVVEWVGRRIPQRA